MNLFELLNLELPSLKPKECKVHLASWNKRDDPLDVFLAGEFPAWQEWQGRKNFERPYIVSLIKMPFPNKWIFAGVHSTHGCEAVQAQLDRPWEKGIGYRPNNDSQIVKSGFRYQTKELPEFGLLTGRLVIEFARPGRQAYLRAEKWTERFDVSELKPRPLAVEDFPGFSNVRLRKWKLDLIVSQKIEAWKAALSSVAGVYLITDTKTGRHYVGSAYGAGGFWGRWTMYSESGHGNNKNLRNILQKEGTDYSNSFQFSILETANINASNDEIIARETHWKKTLCSHESFGGYNG